MPVEDHPRYVEWRMALEKLTEAQAAQECGAASKVDVSLAQLELNKICDEIDASRPEQEDSQTELRSARGTL